MLSANLKSVRGRIAESLKRAGRPQEDVELVCVTKEATLEEVNEVLDLGVGIIGENRVKDAVVKHLAIGGRAQMHLVGHLQTNKAKDAVRIFSLVHSIDSERIAEAVDNEARKAGKVQDVLIQVNTSGETAKFGIAPDNLRNLYECISAFTNINVIGLMTIAPAAEDPEKVRPLFRKLRSLRDMMNKEAPFGSRIRVLSMGMTDDFEVAIEEGANMVRIGRAIFGHRRICDR